MKPILFAPPRSGSTIIGELLGNLAEQLWNSKGYLGEFFNVNQNLVTEAKILPNGRLYLQRNQYVDRPWCLDISKERLGRKALVDKDPNYVIKFLIGQVEPWTKDWVIEHEYTPIFIERKDKVNQLISFLTANQTNQWYYHKSRSNDVVKQIIYDEECALRFIWILREYKQFKNQFENSITIEYEDFMDKGGNQKALVDILRIRLPYNEIETDSSPTPYLLNSQSLIEQDANWLKSKERITKLLNEI